MNKGQNKQVNNQQVNGQQVNNGNQHVQLGGMAFYDESKCFLFAPDEHGVREKVQGFRSQGVAQQLSDGTFDFVVKPRIRSQSELIRKLAHGRVSKTGRPCGLQARDGQDHLGKSGKNCQDDGVRDGYFGS